MEWARGGHPKKWLSILDAASVRLSFALASSWKFTMWHQSRGIKTRARAANMVCFKSGTFEIGAAGEYCF